MRNTFTPRSRPAWRKWLAANHASRAEVWLVFYKKATRKPTLSYGDAVEEALCFGWIDGLKKRIDAERYTHRFTPRAPASSWSRSNRERVAKLEQAGLMMPAGRAAVLTAKRSGHWERREPSRDTGMLPEELEAELERNRQDAARFTRVPPSHQRAYGAYVASAKQAATRIRRARRVIEVLRAGGTPIDV